MKFYKALAGLMLMFFSVSNSYAWNLNPTYNLPGFDKSIYDLIKEIDPTLEKCGKAGFPDQIVPKPTDCVLWFSGMRCESETHCMISGKEYSNTPSVAELYNYLQENRLNKWGGILGYCVNDAANPFVPVDCQYWP